MRQKDDGKLRYLYLYSPRQCRNRLVQNKQSPFRNKKLRPMSTPKDKCMKHYDIFAYVSFKGV